ncbi:MAG: 16S rRNA (guanine(966)-N(2))-methyltransferase RsmD [Lachnospiraceae bacterium]|nr:16S rRNA (guanine(966)-N(2))-methyltransferase RsmD [Lachnospiraceae bacterium]
MRVIAGSARRLLLKTPEGMDTRPTQDRIKETLFNIIQDQVPGRKFLDLFSGSGGIGIEALSRGAQRAVFVDNSKKAQECIRYNLNHTHLADQATLISADVFSSIRAIEREGVYDVVYMDPPYESGYDAKVLTLLKGSKAINEDTLVIIEATDRRDTLFVEQAGFEIIRIKEYKTNKHVFCRLVSDSSR